MKDIFRIIKNKVYERKFYKKKHLIHILSKSEAL